MFKSLLMLTSSSAIIIAIAVTIFVFVIVFAVWQYVMPIFKKFKKKPKSKTEPSTGNLLFNKDGDLKTFDKDFEDFASQRKSMKETESQTNDNSENEIEEGEFQEITKESVERQASSVLEDLPIPAGKDMFDDEFFEMSKIDENNEDDSVKSQLSNLTPEMKAIVFSNLLDKKDF